MTSERSPAPGGEPPPVWVTIEATTDLELALEVEQCLRAAGLEVRATAPPAAGGGATSSREIQVPEVDLERALAALEDLDARLGT